MNGYYVSIVILSCLALIVMSLLVYENGRLDRETKKQFYRTYAMIILAALAECTSVLLNGAPQWTTGIHTMSKCIDYIFTPIAGVQMGWLIYGRGPLYKPMQCLLGANVILQLISIFTGWTFYLDGENYYHHGPYYFVYAVIYCLVILFVLAAFLMYGENFKKQNRGSLYGIVLLTCIGIAMQELLGSGIRTSCLSFTLGSVFLFIHYSEFVQLKSDDHMKQQRILIETDALTGIRSRHAYSQALTELHQKERLPEKLTVFMVDIDGLKRVNDDLGHEAGDELIRGAAACLTEVFQPWGTCYRTGGDEFVILAEMEPEQIPVILKQLEETAAGWSGQLAKALHMSAGYAVAAQYPDLTIEPLVNVADQMMLAKKEAYYKRTGIVRRKQ